VRAGDAVPVAVNTGPEPADLLINLIKESTLVRVLVVLDKVFMSFTQMAAITSCKAHADNTCMQTRGVSADPDSILKDLWEERVLRPKSYMSL